VTPAKLRQILEQTIASAYSDEQLLPVSPPSFVTVQRNEMVTVLPTSEWTNLVFAIHELTAVDEPPTEQIPGAGQDGC
jgi:hypothetical protein